MKDDLERRIDELYALPLDRFTAARDALAGELRDAGDRSAAEGVKALRKPVVAAWALNALGREDPGAVAELLELGKQLRRAHRQALSGGDVEALRRANDERRRLVGGLARRASEILERSGTAAGSHEDDLASTIDAVVVDEEAGELLRSGRVTKALQPPSGFGDGAGLRLLAGGRRARAAEPARSEDSAGERLQEAALVRRELRAAEGKARRAADAVERARGRIEELDRRRTEAREALRAAESEHRGAELERRRLAARLDRLGPSH